MLRRPVLVLAMAAVLAALGGDSQAAPSASGRIAFQSGDSGLCVIDVDGSNRSCNDGARQIEPFQGCVAFSPDGRSIVFVRNGREDDGLYMMNVDGSYLRRLIEPPEWKVVGPVFSPDGHKIVFTSISLPRVNTGPTQGEQFYVMAADGSYLAPIPVSPEGRPVSGGTPAFSPDGRKIVFASGLLIMGIVLIPDAIYVINADGSEMKRLTEPPSKQGDSLGDRNPAFSPDGRKIVFDRGATFIPPSSSRLYVMIADGSHLTPLTGPPGGDSHPAFSLDGRKIVFSSTRGNTDPSQGAQLYVMNADGSHLTRLTDPPGSAECPVFIR